MADKLTSRERFSRIYQHKEADRVPIADGPWGTTIERWKREGMPDNISWVDYFGLDHMFSVGGDNSPRYESKVIEDTEDYVNTIASALDIKTIKSGNTKVLFNPMHGSGSAITKELFDKMGVKYHIINELPDPMLAEECLRRMHTT